MKKIIMSTTAIAVLTGMFCFTSPAYSQSKSTIHKVGLVDMAHIFKNYKKFEDKLTELTTQMKVKDNQGKAKIEALKTLGGKMKALSPDSPDYTAAEAELAKASSDLAAFKKVAERDFMRKQSKIYKEIYMEVKDVIDRAAKGNGYTLVLRFNSQGLDAAVNPQEILSGMNRQVVYHNTRDDLTPHILKYLNSNYKGSSKGSSKTSRSASGKKPARQ